ncbi:acetyl-CoA carboxylase biotin carboxyl carrier protein [Leptothermofonsia sichuanensis E412]|uniref:acetyl-CoA carboxylase biotin carboxyl carrier protein n=1 Tax=Leptothermofonsia sichuanensis TaxID=2917832 RepID=UPI001CA5F7FC|nr:acetyl-CoA carboxylase biotin carboxyl carrier protein [Leptothermofonsia sichuanensis]QZZ20804.1 acetyl-CoA carboxylase biotin carboxyl carrier protein [Leptothermofonsia sichuanensis E412]
MPLDLNELRDLLTAISQTDIAELTLKSADFELTVRRGFQGQTGEATSSILEGAPAAVVPPAGGGMGAATKGGAEVLMPPSAQSSPPPTSDRRLSEIVSPMVGTFYRSPAPDEPPFVELGDRIRKGQTVCIIEAMKLMNELESEVAGEIVEILVQNGQPVEYGQILMRVNPD